MFQGRRVNPYLPVTIVGFLCLWPQPAMADPFLGQLQCVSVQASVLEVGGSFGVTTDVLRDAILTGLKTQVPSLKTDSGCPDRISYKVFLQNFSAGSFNGFFGHVVLELTRKAIFRDTALVTAGQAWDLESYLNGTRDKARVSVLDQLSRLLAQFAADYRSANKVAETSEPSASGSEKP